MTACAYRSLEPVLVHRLGELRQRREQDAVFVGVALGVAARRIGRAVGGAVGIAFGGAAMLVAVGAFLLDYPAQGPMRAAATTLLLGAWPLALVAGLAGRWTARALLSLDTRMTMTGDAATDLANLQARDPLRDTCSLASRWERRSAALPLAAVSLMAPLSLHWIVWCLLDVPHIGIKSAEDFGSWIGVSAVLVGHAHIALLVAAVRWTRKLRTLPTLALRVDLSRAWGLALGVAVGVACLPGVVLLGIPPILVAVTGLCFVPLMFHVTARRIERERLALEAT
jgi:hypothetical protein